MNVTSFPESLAPACEKGLLWHSMDKRAMFENCAVDHSTICFICTPIQWNLNACHLQEWLVCDYPRVSYEVTKKHQFMNSGHQRRGESFGRSRAHERWHTVCCHPCDPQESRTVPALKWWLLCCCIHTWGLIPFSCIWSARMKCSYQ